MLLSLCLFVYESVCQEAKPLKQLKLSFITPSSLSSPPPSLGWHKIFFELYINHFQVDWMFLLLRYCFVIFHIDLNLGPDTPNKVTNKSPSATTGLESLSMIAAGLWLVTLLGVSAAGFCTMCEITKQYLNKIIQSNRKCLIYRSEKFLRQHTGHYEWYNTFR